MAMRRAPSSDASRRPPALADVSVAKFSRASAKSDTSAHHGQLADIRARLGRLENRGASADVDRLRQKLDAQSQQLAALTAKLDAVLAGQQALRADLVTVETALPRVEDELRQSIDDLQDSLAAREVLPSNGVVYRQMVRRIRAVVRASVPRNAAVIIVGKADNDLWNLHARRVLPFPQAADGSYAGFYPACSTSAIVHLEALRSKGADYLIVPETSRWWLDHYADFRRHLEQRYRAVVDEAGAGLLFALRLPPALRDAWIVLEDALARFRSERGRDPAILDWNTGLDLAARLPRQAVFSPPAAGSTLPYLDRTVDMVAVAPTDAQCAEEADRVAETAVVSVGSSDGAKSAGPSISIRWKSEMAAVPQPTASIIIPCFNGVAHTDVCLAALRETLPDDFEGEIIVVDDASTDETAACLARWAGNEKRLKVIRNRANAGFIRTTNKGAKAAAGEILVFLNNDTIPVAGWLPPLLRALAADPTVGAVGGRLVYPDGRLQEAGSVVFRDGSAANFGRDDLNPDLPLYTFLRDVDYCSAALMATRRSLFREIGGFDTHYEPGYYEDTDYCFKLRDKGYRVVVQPESVVVHVEGGTAGLDVSRGMKRFQVVNQQKFQRRWSHVLQRQAVRPDRLDFAALHGLAIRGTTNGDAAR